MIKTLIFFAFLLAIAFGGAWLADRPGEIIINWPWLDTGFEISLLVGFLLVLAAMAIAVIFWVALRGLLKSPGAISGFFSARRRDKGYKALSTGMIAVGVGDLGLARKQAAKARKLIGQEPMTLMLEAQTAQLAGDVTKARQSFESMLDIDETKALGRRGLYIEAQRRGDVDEAMAMAKSATIEGKKSPGWAGTALFDMQTGSEDWQGALVTLSNNQANKLVTRDVFRRYRAVLLTAQAFDLEGKEDASESMRSLLLEACKLAPGLVPAVTRAAEMLNDAKDYRKASKLIEAAWRIEPHPDLAVVYVSIKSGETALDRVKRMRALHGMMPDHTESKLAMARAFLGAREWSDARALIEPLSESHLTPRICMLMAELEEGEKSDFGLVRQWLARAMGAHRDPVWTADGQVSEVWQPTSSVTGKLDAFEWKVPVRELAQSPLPILESSSLEDEAGDDSEPEMILIPSEPSAQESEVTAALEAEEPEVEDIVPNPAVETEATVETTGPVAVAEESDAPLEAEATADTAETPEPETEAASEAVAKAPVEEAIEADADAVASVEAVKVSEADKAQNSAADADSKTKKSEIKKPRKVEFALPHAPDDPGPKGDPLPQNPEKRFRLF